MIILWALIYLLIGTFLTLYLAKVANDANRHNPYFTLSVRRVVISILIWPLALLILLVAIVLGLDNLR